MALKFLVLALVLFALLYYPWQWVSPYYSEHLVAALTNRLFLPFTFQGEYKSVIYDRDRKLFVVIHEKDPDPRKYAFSSETCVNPA